jgi:hypothetical protein
MHSQSSPLEMLQRPVSALAGRPDGQVADLYIVRLLDRESDCPGHRTRRDA